MNELSTFALLGLAGVSLVLVLRDLFRAPRERCVHGRTR